jgi:mRNA interferase RelE/StbE
MNQRKGPAEAGPDQWADAYRLRVGDYRVFFEFDGGVKLVSIEEVKKRDERTY